MSSTEISGSLITRQYTDFRGVDFTKKDISLTRSPDALNMWKNYKSNLGKCIETRPDLELLKAFNNSVFGLFFYTIEKIEHMIVHCGTKLYDIVNGEEKVIFEGMNVVKSQSFIYNNIFYIKDGINYLQFDGESCHEVTGYIPTTTISRAPLGGGTKYQDINMLTGIRRNSFCADGETKEYHLDAEQIDSDFNVIVVCNDNILKEDIDYSVNTSAGIITFNEVPSKPLTDGQDNVVITFRKTINGYKDRINGCTLLAVFDNRIFFSGNPNYPNVIWHTSLNDPTYCSDLDYYNEGDLSKVKAIVPGNNALWVFKEPSQGNTTIFYHNPTIDSEYGKTYPSTHSSISAGCVSTGINFNDDIVFFSDRGMEAISGDVTTEQVLAHRSSLVDNKLLNEEEYKNLILEEWEGYLLVIVENKVYLADSREIFTNENHNEYEWFYWELDKKVLNTQVRNGILYLCTSDGIYTLTGSNDIYAYWTTPQDSFKYPQYNKTTNKRGCVVDMEGNEISVYTKTDSNDYEMINTYQNTKGYVVCRIKKKKWKNIQLKFSSNKYFALYSCILEAYVGGYIKR